MRHERIEPRRARRIPKIDLRNWAVKYTHFNRNPCILTVGLCLGIIP